MSPDVETNYCRRCMKNLPAKDFYDCVDLHYIDRNGLMSVCKKCMQEMYDELFSETQTMEKSIHKMCTSLNIKYSNEAVSATRKHMNSLIESGKKVSNVFGIYKQKLLSINPSMDKSVQQDLSYEDVGTIYTSEKIDTKEIPIPQDVITFWGKEINREDIIYLENEYANFKQTHKADTYAEIVLLKEVCYTMLEIKNLRRTQDDTEDAVKRLQSLMKNLAISPNAIASSGGNRGTESFGLWIETIEREEPAQWLANDPRGDMYRDVGNVEEYFQKYIVRPLKNFILGSKDFNVDDSVDFEDDLLEGEERPDYKLIDDEEV